MEHVDVLRRDLKLSLRSLLKNRLMTVIAVFVLAIGIGANTALFSVVNLMLIHPLPVPAPEQVVRVTSAAQTGTVSYEQYLQFRDQNRTFSQLAGFEDREITYRADGPPDLTVATMVTGNYFQALRVPALVGRTFAETDDRRGAPGVAMLSENFWRDQFNADRSVIGRTITIDGVAFTVVGVTPEWFGGADRDVSRDLWLPWNGPLREIRDGSMIGRLRDGISIAQAQADLSVIASQFKDPRAMQPFTVTVHAAHMVPPVMSRQVVPLFAFFLVLVALSLTIPCLNIGSLFLARAAERHREMGNRIALGAGRGQLLRQLLTESFLVAVIACIAGMCTFLATLGVFVSFFELSAAYASRLVLDWRVAVFGMLLSLVTTVMSGMAPAFYAASTDVVSALKDGEAAGAVKRSRLRAVFIIAQVAVSALLLAMSGLFVRSLTSSRITELGFNTANVLTGRISLDSREYGTERAALFYEKLLQILEAEPGITSANLVEANGPLGAGAAKSRTSGGTPNASSYSEYIVSPGHFRTLEIPLLTGRDFSAGDRQGRPRVGIVNEALAQQNWPGQTPIGKLLEGIEIVGVVRDTNYFVNSNIRKQFLYLPLAQNTSPVVMLVVKARGDASSIVSTIRAAVVGLDPNVPVSNLMPLTTLTSLSLLPVRIVAVIAGILGITALGLAATGIYGTVAFLARQRTREIGIRIAMGAHPRRIVQFVTREALLWILTGLILGLGAAILVGRAVRGLIYGVSPADPIAYLAVTLLLGIAAFLASWIPARRASRIDPIVALRHE